MLRDQIVQAEIMFAIMKKNLFFESNVTNQNLAWDFLAT